jgi:hypothetical protein
MEITEEFVRSLVQALRDEFDDRLSVVEERSMAAYNMADEACEKLDVSEDDLLGKGKDARGE